MRMFQKIFLIIAMTVLMLTGCGKSIEQQVAEQLELGNRYLAEMDYEQAIVAFTKAIELDPKNVEAYICLCEAYMEAGNFDEAMAQLELGYEKTGDERIQQMLQKHRISLSEDDLMVFQELYQMMETEDYESATNYLIKNEESVSLFCMEKMPSVTAYNGILLFDGIELKRCKEGKGMVLSAYMEETDTPIISQLMCYYGDVANGIAEGKGCSIMIVRQKDSDYFGYTVGEWKNGKLEGEGFCKTTSSSYGSKYNAGWGDVDSYRIYDGEYIGDMFYNGNLAVYSSSKLEHTCVHNVIVKDGYRTTEGLVFNERETDYERYDANCSVCGNGWPVNAQSFSEVILNEVGWHW